MLETIRADLGYAARLLVRHPGFTAASVAALALAIGANVTVFTLANAFLFKNLPFDDSERIVYVATTSPQRSGTRGVSYPEFLEYRENVAAFEGAGALTTGSIDVSDGAGFPERYRCTYLSAGAFAAIGQRPARGREFRPEDERPGAPPTVILSDAVWRGRYGADDNILGRTIRINDVATTVVAVMAPRMTFPGTSDVWLPLPRPDNLLRRDVRNLTMFARLRPGATERSARAETAVVGERLARAYPATNRDIGVAVQNFNERYNGGETGRLLFWLLWAVGFVLLIACANIANLLLARAVTRSREISIRSSLGASRWRVVRQLVTESLLLAGTGGALGLALGLWGVRLFDAALAPEVKPAYIDFAVDARVLIYTLAITCGTGIVFGLVPALQLSRLDLTTALKEGGVAGQTSRARVLSAMLVVTEVALAVVLLAGAGLMLRSLVNTSRASIGIDPAPVLSLNVNLRRTKYPGLDAQLRFYESLKSRLEAVPTIEAMALTSDLPAESPDDYRYEVEGAPAVDFRQMKRTALLVVGEDYFRSLGLRPRSGREFRASDTPAAPRVAVVNESFVMAAWPRQEAIGRRFRYVERAEDGAIVPGPWLVVAGVVPDVLQDDESFELAPVIYVPYRQNLMGGMEILVRTRVPPAAAGETVRRTVQAIDSDLAVRALRPLEQSLWFRNWRHRVFGAMFAIFAAIALVLASVGLYAVIAHSVNQRTREIGVRMALGATSRDILRLVFGQAMIRFTLGLAIGLAGAVATTSVLESMLVGITASDPLTLVIVSAILAAAGAAGCSIPARRAIRVDPVIALRNG